MTPFWSNGVVDLHQGDVRAVLRELPAGSVQTCVTSPPYWGLRDYGLEPLVWGGDEGCAHAWEVERYYVNGGGSTGVQGGAFAEPGSANAQRIKDGRWREDAFCSCGAWRGSLGLEPTIDLYVQHIVEVFREVRRVLRKDATLWLNMGDSYAGSGKGQMGNGQHSPEHGTKQGTNAGTLMGGLPIVRGKRMERGDGRWGGGDNFVPGLKPKDLCMMPARVALALQADGWWLRSDIVWSKPNPMPESVTDRPTRSHEYLFLLTKAERYFYDAEAIREPMSDVTYRRLTQPSFHQQTGGPKDPGDGNRSERRALINQNEKLIRQEKWGSRYIGYEEWKQTNGGRNKRSVWEIATEPYPDAHFATFPQKLVEPCILAGTPAKGSCTDCGAPSERVVESHSELEPGRKVRGLGPKTSGIQSLDATRLHEVRTSKTTGWCPTCDHDAEPEPAMVLDPFVGSGTTAYVAQRLGRRAIGIDLSTEYLTLAQKRLRGQTLPMDLTV